MFTVILTGIFKKKTFYYESKLLDKEIDKEIEEYIFNLNEDDDSGGDEYNNSTNDKFYCHCSYCKCVSQPINSMTVDNYKIVKSNNESNRIYRNYKKRMSFNDPNYVEMLKNKLNLYVFPKIEVDRKEKDELYIMRNSNDIASNDKQIL
ncbi:hypothetical protein ABK040_011244 [Willaertia magna]